MSTPPSGMDFFEGFAWSVPRAFSTALAACRFEQGDLLYSDRSAYGAWSKLPPNFAYSLQVLNPPKGARALSPEAEGRRFDAHWESEAEIELTDCATGRREICTTTQGRLYRCLWLGDPDQLDPTGPDPGPPSDHRALHRRLEEARGAFGEHFGASFTAPFWLFLSAVDEASDAARVKAAAIQAALSETFEISVALLWPAQAGIVAPAEVAPTIRLQGIAISARDAAPIEGRLRGLLYGGESEEGRFSLARHGLLTEVGEE